MQESSIVVYSARIPSQFVTGWATVMEIRDERGDFADTVVRITH